MKRNPASARALLMNSMPPMFGMLMSVMMRSGLAPPCSVFSATDPSLASRTLKPAISRLLRKLISMVLESSTIMIVFAIYISS